MCRWWSAWVTVLQFAASSLMIGWMWLNQADISICFWGWWIWMMGQRCDWGKNRKIWDHNVEVVWVSGFCCLKQIIAKGCKIAACSSRASVCNEVIYWRQIESQTLLKMPKLNHAAQLAFTPVYHNKPPYSHRKNPMCLIEDVGWIFLNFLKSRHSYFKLWFQNEKKVIVPQVSREDFYMTKWLRSASDLRR